MPDSEQEISRQIGLMLTREQFQKLSTPDQTAWLMALGVPISLSEQHPTEAEYYLAVKTLYKLQQSLKINF
jgi:hypothetical protein